MRRVVQIERHSHHVTVGKHSFAFAPSLRLVKPRSCAVREPYLRLRISPAALLWATLETFDPFPGSQPLWGDVSRFPDKQFAFASAWYPWISPRFTKSPAVIVANHPENLSRDSKAASFKPDLSSGDTG
jgi:hypothetical protein